MMKFIVIRYKPFLLSLFLLSLLVLSNIYAQEPVGFSFEVKRTVEGGQDPDAVSTWVQLEAKKQILDKILAYLDSETAYAEQGLSELERKAFAFSKIKSRNVIKVEEGNETRVIYEVELNTGYLPTIVENIHRLRHVHAWTFADFGYMIEENQKIQTALEKVLDDGNSEETALSSLINRFNAIDWFETACCSEGQEKLDALNKSIALCPGWPAPNCERGKYYRLNKEYDKAIADYTKAIEIDPGYTRSYLERANVYSYSDQQEQAIADYYNWLKADPQDERPYSLLSVHYASIPDLNKSLEILTLGIAANPKSVKLYHDRGLVYSRRTGYKDAVDDFTHAIDIEPENGMYYAARGEAYINWGKYIKAEEDITKAIQLGYNSAKNLQRRLYKLK